MSFLQHVLILFTVILINYNSYSTTTTKSITIESIYEPVANENLKLQDNLKNDQEELKIDHENFELEKKQIQNFDVIQLNVGGQIMTTTYETLTRIEKSILAIMFNDRWKEKLPMDENKNIFLDFNPILFRHLLDQLQLLDTNNLIKFYPPSEPSLVESFNKMLRKLGFDKSLLLEKNIINFNVGGHIITTQRITFNQISNFTFDTIISSSKITKFYSNSDIFLDYDPKLFQHLIKQLREKSSKNISYFEAPSNKERNSFKRMLRDLNIYRQINSSININNNTKWIQDGITIAGGHGKGNGLSQLNWPEDIYINDDDQSIYIADSDNHRIVEWQFNAKNGQVIAGGNEQGNRIDQLDYPADVIVDTKNDSIIICDHRNRRVVRWPRQDGINGQTIIFNIDCYGLAMDNNGNLYISDLEKNEVRRWKIGDTNGTIVAGGNGEGDNLNQLSLPTSIFVDQNHSVYISDEKNHRVMKWMKDAKEGIVVAGGQGEGNNLTQLYYPQGVIVDHSGHVYVADSRNHRIMRWLKESQEGSIIVGGNGNGKQSNQLNYPKGLSFDRQGNLYVVDWNNNRIQKFDIDLN